MDKRLNRTSRWILLSILLVAAGMLSYRMDHLWLAGHHGYNGAQAGLIARNFERFGPLVTQLAPALDTGPVLSEQPALVLDHPSFLFYSVALSFEVFGVSEWSATLVVILYSLGSLLLVFEITRRLWGTERALTAAAFAALIPVNAYYGRVLIHEVPTLFFMLLTLLFYLQWLDDKRPRSLWLLRVAYLFAMLSDWPGYYIGPLVAAHYLLFHFKGERNLRFPISTVFLGLGIGILQLAHIWLLSGSLGWLFDHALWRSLPSREFSFTTLTWVERLLFRCRDLITPLPVVLCVVWFGWTALRRNRTRWSQVGIVVLLGLFGMTHAVIFRQHSWIHEYWMIFLTPFFAISGSLGLSTLLRTLPGLWKAALTGVTLLIFSIQAFPQVQDLNAQEQGDASLVAAVREVQRRVAPEKKVMSSIDLGLSLSYYLDRRSRAVLETGELQALSQEGGGYTAYLFFREDRRLKTLHEIQTPLLAGDLKEYLLSTASARLLSPDITLFDLTADPDRTADPDLYNLLFPYGKSEIDEIIAAADEDLKFDYIVDLCRSLPDKVLGAFQLQDFLRLSGAASQADRLTDEMQILGRIGKDFPNHLTALCIRSHLLTQVGDEAALGKSVHEIEEMLGPHRQINLEDRVVFLGYRVSPGPWGVTLSLYFHCLQTLDRDYSVWIHGRPADRTLLGQGDYNIHDVEPQLPTTQWQSGAVYEVSTRLPNGAGRYPVSFGFWATDPERRLLLKGGQGADNIELDDLELP